MQQDLRMIESLLQRRYELNNANALAKKIADAIAARTQSPELQNAVSHLNDFEFRLYRLCRETCHSE